MGQKSKKNLYFCMVLCVTDFLHYLIKYFELPTKGQKIKKNMFILYNFVSMSLHILLGLIKLNKLLETQLQASINSIKDHCPWLTGGT